MKAASFLVDDDLEALLESLTKKRHMSVGAIIREAVMRYSDQMDEGRLTDKLGDASRKTRDQLRGLMRAMESVDGEGIY